MISIGACAFRSQKLAQQQGNTETIQLSETLSRNTQVAYVERLLHTYLAAYVEYGQGAMTVCQIIVGGMFTGI